MAQKRDEKKFAQGVKQMTDEELSIELKRLRGGVYDLRSQAVTGKVENLASFGTTRRNIARVLTEQKARALKANPRPTKAPAPVKAAPGRPRSTKAAAAKGGRASGRKAKAGAKGGTKA